MSPATPKMISIASEIVEERQRQVDKFGEQRHPDGLGHAPISAANFLAEARARCDKATSRGSSDTYGTLTWEEILTEEYAEALCETDPDKLRVELLQVAAVCAAWIEDIDSRKP